MVSVLVNAVQSGQGATHSQRPTAYQVRGAAAAVLAELAQREQYKDEILTSELVPYLLQLIDVRLASEGVYVCGGGVVVLYQGWWVCIVLRW